MAGVKVIFDQAVNRRSVFIAIILYINYLLRQIFVSPMALLFLARMLYHFLHNNFGDHTMRSAFRTIHAFLSLQTMTVLALIRVLTMICFGTFAFQVMAQQWGPEIRVTSHPGNSYRPDIACDSKGNVYIVWEDDRDGNFEIRYAKLDSNGKILIADRRLTNTAPSSRYPKVAIDSRNRVYIVWREDNERKFNANYGLWCAILNENSQPLLPEFIKIEGTGNSGLGSLTPNITIDRFDNLHIVWDQNYVYRTPTDTIYNANEVCYTKIKPVGKVQISKLILTEKGFHASEPAITVDYNSGLNVTWARLALSNLDPRVAYWIIQYTKFDSIGQLIVKTAAITPNTGNSRYQNMIADPKGVNCVYSANRNGKFDIFYEKLDYTGHLMTMETNVSHSAQLATAPKIIAAHNKTFHIVWDEDRYGTTNEIYYARIFHDGKLQLPRIRVDNGTSEAQDTAICMIRSGRIFIVWADKRYKNWDIMLRYLELKPTDIHDQHRSSNSFDDQINDIQIYPSPVKSHAVIRYNIPEKAQVVVSIYDCIGRSVRTFSQKEHFSGYHTISWDVFNDRGQQVPAGIYICLLNITSTKRNYQVARKMLVLK